MTTKTDQKRPEKDTKTAVKQTGAAALTIDVYTSTGTKKGTASLPAGLFGTSINEGLMHQALIRQQSNCRASIAHVKSRGEVQGSTAKLYRQKGTGRARRGSVRSPILRGGGKAFGPRNVSNFIKDMPRKMRRAALRSCLSLQAQKKGIIGLENCTGITKTKQARELLGKLPVEVGRRILVVTPEKNEAINLSMCNIPNVTVVIAAYLNPRDILVSKHIVFLVDTIKKVEEVFGNSTKSEAAPSPKPKAAPKKATSPKPTSKPKPKPKS